MISQLRNQKLIADFLVNNPMFRINPPRPVTLERMLQRLRFANSAVRTAPDLFDEKVNPRDHLRIGFLPVEIIFPRSRREDEIHASGFNLRLIPLPRLSTSTASIRRFAFAGERSR